MHQVESPTRARLLAREHDSEIRTAAASSLGRRRRPNKPSVAHHRCRLRRGTCSDFGYKVLTCKISKPTSGGLECKMSGPAEEDKEVDSHAASVAEGGEAEVSFKVLTSS